MSDRAELLAAIKAKAVIRGDFILSSGQRADWYVDLRRVLLAGRLAPLAGRVMLDLTWDLGYEAALLAEHYYPTGIVDRYAGGLGERDSPDAWIYLAALARETSRIRLGTLVSPVTFSSAMRCSSDCWMIQATA